MIVFIIGLLVGSLLTLRYTKAVRSTAHKVKRALYKFLGKVERFLIATFGD